MANDIEVLYVFDAYCGWCYGFGPTLRAFFEANRGRVPFRVVSGGLFVGSNRVPIGRLGFIGDANRRIADLTGVAFGPAYEDVLREGMLVLDSEAAAAGFAALREQAPERAVELSEAMQRAFFAEGHSLSDPATFAAIADAEGLDASRLPGRLENPESAAWARADFALARQLGVRAFPTLLVRRGNRLVALPGVGATAERLTRQLDSILAAA
jgi:putative protein-disulfide isomerase